MENLELNPSFWENQTVLITGHTGFKGTWLALWLSQLNANVIGYALEPNTRPSLFEQTDIQQDITSIIGDIRHRKHITQIMQEYQPKIVIHMAAQPLVRESYNDPITTFETNILGTAYAIEAAQKANVQTFINVTTDKCYDNINTGIPFKESDPLGGHDPYSASKACSELISSSYRNALTNSSNKGSLNIATARAGNVIGGGDFSNDRLIPDEIRSIQHTTPLNIRYPQATRPWQHVFDVLHGYLLLAQKLYSGETQYASAWNFGPPPTHTTSVQNLIEIFFKNMKQKHSINFETNEQPYEALQLSLDSQKASTYLHWKPLLSLQDNLKLTAQWYSAFLNTNESLKQMSLQQIQTYQERVLNNVTT